MPESTPADVFVRLLAERAAHNESYLAWAIHAFAESEDLPIDSVIARLGVAEPDAADFLICLKPAGDQFGAMVQTIVSRFNLDPDVLLIVLRHVEVVDTFRTSSTGASGSDSGALLAARMRTTDVSTQGSPGTGRDSSDPDRDES
jgi:hypothetical protein